MHRELHRNVPTNTAICLLLFLMRRNKFQCQRIPQLAGIRRIPLKLNYLPRPRRNLVLKWNSAMFRKTDDEHRDETPYLTFLDPPHRFEVSTKFRFEFHDSAFLVQKGATISVSNRDFKECKLMVVMQINWSLAWSFAKETRRFTLMS